MKRDVCLTGALLALLAGASLANSDDGDGRPGALAGIPAGARVAVVASQSTGGAQVDGVIGDMVMAALAKRGIRLVERAALDAITRERQLAAEAGDGEATGRIRAAAYVLAVKATEFGVKENRIGGILGSGTFGGLQIRSSTARVVIDARLSDVRNSNVIVTERGAGSVTAPGATIGAGRLSGGSISLGGIDFGSKEWSESSLGRAARRATDDLIGRLTGGDGSVVGDVLAVDGHTVVASLGSGDGVRPGDKVTCFRLETTRNSKGEVVWSEEREVCELRVEAVRLDGCRLSGPDGVREGDLVRASVRRPTKGGRR